MTGIRFTRLIGSFAAVASAACALLVAADPASAQPRPLLQEEATVESVAPAQRDQLFPAQREGGVSLAQATAMAQSRFPGRVVRAEPVRTGDRVIYEIRILGEDGRTVRSFRIDAQTGAFL